MALLVEVFSELFRSFGYATRLQPELEGLTGRKWPTPLVAEKDTRRVAVQQWLRTDPLPEASLDEFLDLVKDTGSDSGLLLSLGTVPDALLMRAARHRIQVWDPRRITQELGTAVLHETCPNLWEHSDPLVSPRPSRILERVQESAAAPPVAPAPVPPTPTPPAQPQQELPVVAAVPPFLAPTPVAPAPEGLQVPLAFGVLDAVATPATSAPTPTVTQVPVLAEAPAPPPASPGRAILRTHVNKSLALSLTRGKLRNVERVFLRLVPYHVFDYEAQLLVEGSLSAEVRRGRMAVDAALKKVTEWQQPLDVADLPPEGADVDEKKVRVDQPEALKLLVGDLRNLVTRDVLMQEDDSEWSVVVKKKVSLAEDEVRASPLGLYWLPLWRVTGKEGSMEIDAVTGRVVFEEIFQERSNAQLI